MRGYDYLAGKPVNQSYRHWRDLTHKAVKQGGFVREDRTLGETFIYRRVQGKADLVAEVYDIDCGLEPRKETKNG